MDPNLENSASSIVIACSGVIVDMDGQERSKVKKRKELSCNHRPLKLQSHKGGLLSPLACSELGIAGCPGLVPSGLVTTVTTTSLTVIITGGTDRVGSTWYRRICGAVSIDAGCDEHVRWCRRRDKDMRLVRMSSIDWG